MKTTIRPKAIAKLLLPSAPLASCLFGAIIRDTRGCDLSHDQRFSFFAASPLCGISWTFEGQSHLLEDTDQMSDPSSAPIFPKLAFSGPHHQPCASWNAGDFSAMTLAFYPDAFATLTGIDVAEYTNRNVPIEEVLSGDLLQLAKDALETGDAESAFHMIEQKLTPLWQEARPGGAVFGHHIVDWCRSFMVRAAMSEVGKSARQVQRYFKIRTGQSQRSLLTHARSDQAFQYALAEKENGNLNLAGMSADLGYSDQSHMSREIKKITGFSPLDFLEHYDHDEAFWCFRLMGERF